MKCTFYFLIIFFLHPTLQAQEIKGKITDVQNEAVSGAVIRAKSTFLSAVSDPDGNFVLSVPTVGSYVLEISSVGYESVDRQVFIDLVASAYISVSLKESASLLKEVTITASRKPEVVDRTPASVQVIRAHEIENQATISSSLSSILGYMVPSLALGSNGTSNTGQTLRGRTPLVMIDGIPQSTPLRNGARDIRTIDPSVIERVEVIKGATALYGNGADGGIINYITTQAPSAKGFMATTSIAKTGMATHARQTGGYRIQQKINGKTGQFDYALAGMYEKIGVFKDAKGGMITPVNSFGETALINVFSKVGYTVNEKNRLEVMYNYFSSKQNSQYIEQAGKYNESPTIGVRGEVKTIDEGTRYNHNAYIRYQAKQLFFNTSLEFSAYLQNFYTVYGYSVYFIPPMQSAIRATKTGARLTLNTPWNIGEYIENEWLYGVDYLNDKTWQNLTDGRIWVPKMHLQNPAPFVQFSSTLYKNWVLKAGWRLDKVSLSVSSFSQIKTSQTAGGKVINGGYVAFSASTFNTGLRYTKWEFFKPFATFTQGFSMVDIGLYVRNAKEDDIAKMQLQPIVVNNYELGFSSSISKVSVMASAYASTSKIGATIVEKNGIFVQQRAPERIIGIEASVDVAAIKNFTVGAGISYMEGKVDIDKNGNYRDSADVYLTNRRIIPLKIVSHLKYTPGSRLFIDLEWVYTGSRKRFTPQANGKYKFGEGPVNAYGIVNFNTRYVLTPKLSLYLGVENLLNKDYYSTTAQWYALDAYYIKSSGARYQLGINYKW